METEKLLDTHQAVKYLLQAGVLNATRHPRSNYNTLWEWRAKKTGPAYIKTGTGRIRYAKSALNNYIKDNSGGAK